MAKLIAAVIAVLALISLIDSSSMSKRGFRLCGERLTEALTMVCGGAFYGPGQNSRRDIAEEATGNPWFLSRLVSQSNEGSHFPSIIRRQLGVAHECCTNPCSFSDLAAYCAK